MFATHQTMEGVYWIMFLLSIYETYSQKIVYTEPVIICNTSSVPEDVMCLDHVSESGYAEQIIECTCITFCQPVQLICTVANAKWERNNRSQQCDLTHKGLLTGDNSLVYRFSNGTFYYWCINPAIYDLDNGAKYSSANCVRGVLTKTQPKCIPHGKGIKVINISMYGATTTEKTLIKSTPSISNSTLIIIICSSVLVLIVLVAIIIVYLLCILRKRNNPVATYTTNSTKVHYTPDGRLTGAGSNADYIDVIPENMLYEEPITHTWNNVNRPLPIPTAEYEIIDEYYEYVR